MLRRTVTASQPNLDQRLLELLDAIDEPVSIATAIRDREGRILDFRLDFVNLAAAAGRASSASAMIGMITGELLPEFRSSGFFDTLQDVVETGVPYHESGAEVADAVTGGCVGRRACTTCAPSGSVTGTSARGGLGPPSPAARLSRPAPTHRTPRE